MKVSIIIVSLVFTVIHRDNALPTTTTVSSPSSSTSSSLLPSSSSRSNHEAFYHTYLFQQVLDNPVTREHLLQYLNEKDLIKMSKVKFFKKYALTELSERYHKIVFFQNGFNFPKRKFDDIVKPFNTIEKVLHPAAIIFDDGILSTDLMHNYSSKILIWYCNDFTGSRHFRVMSRKNSTTGFVIPAILRGRSDVFMKVLRKKQSVKLVLSFLTLVGVNESTVTHRYAESIGNFLNMNLVPKKVSTEKHICVVSQTLLKPSRDDEIPETSADPSYENGVVIIGGKGVEASTLVINTHNETELREKFEKWNAETISKMDNHQKIAFHLVMTDSEEPENGEDLFKEIFNDIKLVALSSFTNGIISTLSSDNTFERGSIYAIVGFEHNADELCSMLKIRFWPKFKTSLIHFLENSGLYLEEFFNNFGTMSLAHV